MCDFYFEGYQGTVPTFAIQSVTPDSPISPAVMGGAKGTTQTTYTLNAGMAEYICQEGTDLLQPDTQFYTSQQHVQARTFSGDASASHDKKTVLLRLSTVQLEVFGINVNLNPGDGNAMFPEDRRCLLFRVQTL